MNGRDASLANATSDAEVQTLHDNAGCVQVLPHAPSFGGAPRER